MKKQKTERDESGWAKSDNKTESLDDKYKLSELFAGPGSIIAGVILLLVTIEHAPSKAAQKAMEAMVTGESARVLPEFVYYFLLVMSIGLLLFGIKNFLENIKSEKSDS